MARSINRLSVRLVQTVTKEGRFADGGGLYLDTKKGGRRWIFLFRWEGKLRELALGPVAAISLATARELAREAREHVAKGINPIEARAAAREAEIAAQEKAVAAATTFGGFAETFISSIEQGWRNEKHRQQWRNSLRDHAATLHGKPVATIGTGDVLAVLQPIWLTKSETASRVRGRIERILSAAKARGLRDRDSINPATWNGHLEVLLPSRPKLTRGHHPAMPYGKLPDFIGNLRERQATAARALEFLIFAASRTGEVLGAKRCEIDLSAKEWVVPGERMKAGAPHTVLLTDRMMEILQDLGIEGMGPDAYLFSGNKPGRPLSNMCMEMLLRRMKLDHFTVHGFRSSFKDWAINETELPDEISEEALAHTIGSKVRRAYRRGEALARRRRLMEAWHAHCQSKAGDDVVPMKAAA